MFISPEVVLVVRFVVFIFKAVLALPKLPVLLVRVTEPLDFALIVAAPVVLPLAVVKATVLVEPMLPNVAPFKVMPPVPVPPLLVSMLMFEAVARVGVIVMAVADWMLTFVDVDAVSVIGRPEELGAPGRL